MQKKELKICKLKLHDKTSHVINNALFHTNKKKNRVVEDMEFRGVLKK